MFSKFFKKLFSRSSSNIINTHDNASNNINKDKSLIHEKEDELGILTIIKNNLGIIDDFYIKDDKQKLIIYELDNLPSFYDLSNINIAETSYITEGEYGKIFKTKIDGINGGNHILLKIIDESKISTARMLIDNDNDDDDDDDDDGDGDGNWVVSRAEGVSVARGFWSGFGESQCEGRLTCQ